jgi:hypothetical protein
MIYGNMQPVIVRAGAQRLHIANSKCAAHIKESDANLAQQENLNGLRLYDENMALANVFVKVASSTKIVAAGESGG